MEQQGLMGCARIIVEKMANVNERERVAIITDYNYSSKELTDMILEDALVCSAESVKVLTTPPRGTFISGNLPKMVKAVLEAADVVFACTSSSFPLPVRRDLIKQGKKFMQMHQLDDETVLRTVPIDLDLLETRVRNLVNILSKTEKVRMTSPEGSDVTFSLKDCIFGMVYDGICHPGEVDAIPPGVIDALPVPGTGNGVVVIDGSLSEYGQVKTPVKMTIDEGKILDIKGGTEANWLQKRMKKALAAGDENANHWAEFLIGLNPGADVTSNRRSIIGTHLPREEERRLGNVSIGWGRDTHLGGAFPAQLHGDGIVTDITIDLDSVTIIEEGRWKSETI